MEILIYEPTHKIQKLIIASLISMGLRPRGIHDQNEIIPELMKKSYDLFLTECNINRPDIVQIIEDIKTDDRLKAQKIFLHTGTREKDFIYGLLKSGINGVIFKPFQTLIFKKQLLSALERAKMEHAQRRHIRIRPEPTKKARLIFRSPVTMKMLSGKIEDISLGGVAVSLSEPDNLNKIEEKQIIHSSQIVIKSFIVTTSLMVVVVKGNFIAFKYNAISNLSLTTLCDYIYEQIQKETGNRQGEIESDS